MSSLSEEMIGYGCVSSKLFDGALGDCDGSVVQRGHVCFYFVTVFLYALYVQHTVLIELLHNLNN